MSGPRVTFLGAAGTVTGSRHLVEAGGAKAVDAMNGLLENWFFLIT